MTDTSSKRLLSDVKKCIFAVETTGFLRQLLAVVMETLSMVFHWMKIMDDFSSQDYCNTVANGITLIVTFIVLVLP